MHGRRQHFRYLTQPGGRGMVPHKIKNWDDAYANMTNVPNGATYPDLWTELSTAYRKELQAEGRLETGIPYGPHERNRFDLFLPKNEPVGIHVFIHGGYWMRFDNSYFAHLAEGSLGHGWAVAMPSYPLCPEVTVPDITSDIALAIETIAARIAGPLVVSGHSAGGHLATRMICKDTRLASGTLARIRRVMSISGVHDLRPLLNLVLNNTLQLDLATASDESPALHHPAAAIPLVCWVGAGERSEFIRQNALLANIWTGLGAETLCIEQPDRHHFNVVDDLREADSSMMAILLA